jgi:hypothetical protein
MQAQYRVDREADDPTLAIWHAVSEEVDVIRGRGGLVHAQSLSYVHEGCSCPPEGLGMQCQIGRCGRDFVKARHLLRRNVITCRAPRW